MGTVISKAASGVGAVLGNAFVAPIKTIFGASCEILLPSHCILVLQLSLLIIFPLVLGVCSGTWDLICFIENLCISRLVRLLMVLVLTYITLLFVYLLFKVGIIQCIGRSLCKMTWAACETYWTAMEEISCFLWHKLKNTKRVYRHRFEDIEEGLSSSEDDDSSDDYRGLRAVRRRRSVRERRKDHMRRYLDPTRRTSKGGGRSSRRSGSHHHVRLKTREVSVHVKGSGRIRNSRQLQVRNTGHHSAQQLFKRRRIR